MTTAATRTLCRAEPRVPDTTGTHIMSRAIHLTTGQRAPLPPRPCPWEAAHAPLGQSQKCGQACGGHQARTPIWATGCPESTQLTCLQASVKQGTPVTGGVRAQGRAGLILRSQSRKILARACSDSRLHACRGVFERHAAVTHDAAGPVCKTISHWQPHVSARTVGGDERRRTWPVRRRSPWRRPGRCLGRVYRHRYEGRHHRRASR